MDPVTAVIPAGAKVQSLSAHVQFTKDDVLHNVAIHIPNFAALAAASVDLAGDHKVAEAIVVLSQYAAVALQGFADADAVEITPESILSLKASDVPLKPADDSQPKQ